MDNPIVFRVLLLIARARYLRGIAEDVFALLSEQTLSKILLPHRFRLPLMYPSSRPTPIDRPVWRLAKLRKARIDDGARARPQSCIPHINGPSGGDVPGFSMCVRAQVGFT